jgi:hypothetical protein
MWRTEQARGLLKSPLNSVGNEIDAAMIFAQAHFVNVPVM